MERTNIRNMHNLHGRKIILICLGFFMSLNTFAQNQNWIHWDTERKIHFGFLLGTNFATFKYYTSNAFRKQDSIKGVNMIKYPGISLGAVADLHLGRRFDFRFTPTLTITDRRVNYTFADTFSIQKDVESALIEFPLLFAIHSDRPGNVRFYAVGGFKFSYDLASNAFNSRNPADPNVAVLPINLYYEFGAGLDLFYPYFKFSPEIKLARGINDIFAPHNDSYNNVFSSLRSNIIYFTFYFEG